MQRTSFLAFSVGGKQCCISVSDVQEIAAAEDFQPIPGAPRCIKGIAGIRGKMVTLIEIAEVFGISAEPAIPFSVLLLASPYSNIGLSVYSHIDMKSSSSPPGGSKTIDIDGQEMMCLHARDIFSFCEQEILDLFKIEKQENAMRRERIER